MDRRAVIDIGTNSVKILVADVDGCSVFPFEERAIQIRLGNCVYNGNCLTQEAVERAVSSVNELLQLASSLNAKQIKIIATSPLREIKNSDFLIQSIKEKFNIEVEIISGEKEAELSFIGIIDYLPNTKSKILIADIGGGSSEFIFAENRKIQFLKSYQIGAVRYMQMFNVSDPPTQEEFLKCRDKICDFIDRNILKDLKYSTDFEGKSTDFVGTGGTITILGRMILKENEFNRSKLDNLKINYSSIKDLTKLLWQTPIAERKNIPGLPEDRADVIIFGILIYEVFMELSELDSVFVSTRGLRFGAIKNF